MSDHIASRDHDPSTGAAPRVPARAATTHTPGPWTVADGDPTIVLTEWYDAEGDAVAIADVLVRFGPDDHDDLANARLISAAPDLLEALKAVKERDDFVPILPRNVLALVDAAIAKATSEPQPRAPQVDGEGSRDEPLPPNPSIERES